MPPLRTFLIIWFGQTVSSVGTRITGFALVLWVFSQTGQATTIALVGLSGGLATVLVNLFAGPIVDRYDRKRIMWITDALAGLVTLAYIILFFSGRLLIWHLYIGAAVQGGLNILQRLAFGASVPLMVPKVHHVRASTLNIFTNYAGNIIGPALGVALYYWIGLGGVFLVDVLTFTIAIATILLNKIPQPAAPPPNSLAQPGMPAVELLRARLHQFSANVTYGFRYVFARHGLRALLLSEVIFAFFDGPSNALLAPLILARTGNDAAVYAAVGAASGIGGVAMSLLVSVWGGPKRIRIHTYLLGMVGAGLAKVGISLSRFPTGWVISQGAASAHFPLLSGAGNAIWLAKVDPAIQGRVLATRSILEHLGFYLGMALSAPLGDYLLEPAMATNGSLTPYLGWLFGSGPGAGYAVVIFLAALGMASVGVLGYLLPSLRTNRQSLQRHNLQRIRRWAGAGA